MPFTLTMPKLSPTMEEGTIIKWHVQEETFVEAGELLLEIATDKATVEHSALDEGWLKKILLPDEGEGIVGVPIAIFTAEKEESIEGYVPEGLVEMVEEPVLAKESEEEVVVKVAKKPPKGGLAEPAFEPAKPVAIDLKEVGDLVIASPLARKLAKEQGLDLTTVKGSGPGGRVVERDLAGAQPSSEVGFGRRERPKGISGAYDEEALSPVRKIIGQRLQAAKTFIPHFYVSQEINAAAMVELREQLKTYGVKVSFNDLIVRGVALTLRKLPPLNAGYNSVTGRIVRFHTIDVAVAVSIEGGLVTPLIRHADHKNLGEISAEVRQLAKRARAGKLMPEEYTGGSFTISNLGMYGIRDFIAVLNPPQAAILAVGGIRDEPIVSQGAVIPGKRLSVTLSCDHRVVDGADAAEFLASLASHLENPAGLLLG